MLVHQFVMLKTACFVILLLAHPIFNFILSAEQGCAVSYQDLGTLEPVVVDLNYHILYPSDAELTINIAIGDSIIIGCPGSTLNIVPNISTVAKCLSGRTFLINDKQVDANTLKCKSKAHHIARYTNRTCELEGQEIEIGFDLEFRFVRTIQICFDPITQLAFYSQYNLTKYIGNHDVGVGRPSFVQDGFYNIGSSKLNNLYIRATQRATINKLLGLDSSSVKYIQSTSDYYLAKGHFSAKGDFVFGSEQSSTFHYVNSAPQWQTFNGANWNNAEQMVRTYAEKYKLNLLVYTGPYGIATLPHANTGVKTPLYLYTDKNHKSIPVPQLYWKVVYDPLSHKGIALLGVNNPYDTNRTANIVCNDITAKIPWLHWKGTDIEKGFAYACEVDDLRKAVKQLPNFEVSGILIP